ncbi:MAG TPA: ArsR family transcriptional regulator [archaeon]|nr:ArsR family transcriptional regulator [archaeon]
MGQTELEEQEEEKTFLSLDKLLEILGNPTRRRILSKLAKIPLGASELAASFGTKISRQAIHSQLKMLSEPGIIESFGTDLRNTKYRIKSNLSLGIDITPDYYHINFKFSEVINKRENLDFKNTGDHNDYQKIETPRKKLRFIGEKINEIEQNLKNLEDKRNLLLHKKECFIIALKNLIADQYKSALIKKERPNLEMEIFYTIFYNPSRYFKRINIDHLLDDMYFSERGTIRRETNKVSIKYLLRDLSELMGFLREDEDNFWFFDI